MTALWKYSSTFVYFIQLVFILQTNAYNKYTREDDFEQVAGNNILIGFICDAASETLTESFKYAISEANKDLNIKLIGQAKFVENGNSMDAYTKMCELMGAGVGAILSTASKPSTAHVMAFCDNKDLPLIIPFDNVYSYGLNLHPSPMDMVQAVVDILSAFNWEEFVFLYESVEYLNCLNSILATNGTNGPIVQTINYDLYTDGNYKVILRKVRNSIYDKVVIMGSTSTVAALLKQALQVGIINEDYKYIIGNLDFHGFEIEEYKHSGANITSLRMFSTKQPQVHDLIDFMQLEYENIDEGGFCPLTMEMALIYDAVQIIAETTAHITYQPSSVNCSEKSNIVQADGLTFYNYMRSVYLNEKTITGRVHFEDNIRKDYKLDIIELQETGIVEVGAWSENSISFKRENRAQIVDAVDENSLVNKTLIVLISEKNKPYSDLIESHKTLEGNDQYEGYGIDVIKRLALKLNFNYEFKDGGIDYGTFNKTTNTSTGMLKEIAEGRADLAITDLTITSEREEVVDFSIPFMNLGIAILYQKPQIAPPALFSFMDPFSGEVWLFLGLAFLGVSLSLFILGRLSPAEWDNPYPCIEEPEDLENQFTIGNSLWFSTGALLQQGSEIAPKALSTRTVASIWWFFTLIMVSSYTANLAAFLTVVKPTGVIESVEDLADNKGGVEYGAKKTGSTRNFFSTSDEAIYIKMNEYMTKNPHLLYENNKDGVAKVGPKYAFLMESTSIEYHTVRNCDLMMIGDPLDEKGYGIAMKKNWPYRDKFNNALLELQEQGVLASIKNKWWKEIGAGVCGKEESTGATSLNFKNVSGVYLVLAVGTLFSLIFGLTYWCLDIALLTRKKKVPFTTTFIEELKIAMNFCNNERTPITLETVDDCTDEEESI